MATRLDASEGAYSNWEAGVSIPQRRKQIQIDSYFSRQLADSYSPGELPALWQAEREARNSEKSAVEAPAEADGRRDDQSADRGPVAEPDVVAPQEVDRPLGATWRPGFRRSVVVVTAVVLVGGIGSISLLTAFDSNRDPNDRKSGYGSGRMVTIYNKVVLDEKSVREDSPAYLSTKTANYCRKIGCMTDGTAYGTGDQVRALCQREGEMTTNRYGDTPNSANYDSDVWYLIRDSSGKTGYLSDVWIDPAQRGGYDLPPCDHDLDASILSPAAAAPSS